MKTGGSCASITRICDADVSVRRTMSPFRKSVWSGERVTCPGGMLSASNRCHVSSTSSPSTIVYPRPRKMSSLRCLSRQRDVDALLGQALLEVGPPKRRLPLLDGQLELLAKRVEDAACLGIPHLPERLLQLALTTEVAHTGIVELVERLRARNRAFRLVLQRLGVHGASVSSSCG